MSIYDELRALTLRETYVLACRHPHHDLTPLIVAYSAQDAETLARRQGWRKDEAGWSCGKEHTDGCRDDAAPAGDAG